MFSTSKLFYYSGLFSFLVSVIVLFCTVLRLESIVICNEQCSFHDFVLPPIYFFVTELCISILGITPYTPPVGPSYLNSRGYALPHDDWPKLGAVGCFYPTELGTCMLFDSDCNRVAMGGLDVSGAFCTAFHVFENQRHISFQSCHSDLGYTVSNYVSSSVYSEIDAACISNGQQIPLMNRRGVCVAQLGERAISVNITAQVNTIACALSSAFPGMSGTPCFRGEEILAVYTGTTVSDGCVFVSV